MSEKEEKKSPRIAEQVRTSGRVKETRKSLVLWVGRWWSVAIYYLVVLSIDVFFLVFCKELFPHDLAEANVSDIATIQTGLSGGFIAFIGLVLFFYVGKIMDFEKDAISKSFDYSVKFAKFANSQKKSEDWHKTEIDHYYKVIPSQIFRSVSSGIKWMITTCIISIIFLLISVVLTQLSLSLITGLLSASLLCIIAGIESFMYSWFIFDRLLKNLGEITLILEEAITAVKLDLTFNPRGH